MIVRRIGDVVLADCEALCVHLGRRPVATIRKHCKAVGKDEATGRLLYNVAEAKAALADIPSRETYRRKPADLTLAAL